MSDVFNAVAEQRRRAILQELALTEQPVGALAVRLGLDQSSVSKHLSVLRKVGLVRVRRSGRYMLYRMGSDAIRRIHEWTKMFETKISQSGQRAHAINMLEEARLTHDPCFSIQRAARMLARRFDEELRQISLTNGQFILLILLNCPESPTMFHLSSLLAMDRTTLTAVLKPLERRSIVKIGADAADRRVKRISLTLEGSRLLRTAEPIWSRARSEVELHIPATDLDALQRILGDLASNLS